MVLAIVGRTTIRLPIVGIHGNSNSRTDRDPKILICRGSLVSKNPKILIRLAFFFDVYFNVLIDSANFHPLLAIPSSLVDQLGID
jgi:hypothetical protein